MCDAGAVFFAMIRPGGAFCFSMVRQQNAATKNWSGRHKSDTCRSYRLESVAFLAFHRWGLAGLPRL